MFRIRYLIYYDNMPTEYMEGYNMASQDIVGLLLLLEEMKNEFFARRLLAKPLAISLIIKPIRK